MITVTELLENVTDFDEKLYCILKKHTCKMVIIIFKFELGIWGA
jgi:hypothetical protein